jgi:PP-loop superfamily ATP-utilizing enzyme
MFFIVLLRLKIRNLYKILEMNLFVKNDKMLLKCYVCIDKFTNFIQKLKLTPGIRRVLDHKSSF